MHYVPRFPVQCRYPWFLFRNSIWLCRRSYPLPRFMIIIFVLISRLTWNCTHYVIKDKENLYILSPCTWNFIFLSAHLLLIHVKLITFINGKIYYSCIKCFIRRNLSRFYLYYAYHSRDCIKNLCFFKLLINVNFNLIINCWIFVLNWFIFLIFLSFEIWSIDFFMI